MRTPSETPVKPRGEKVSTAEHTRLRGRLAALGVPAKDLGAAVGATARGRTRDEWIQDLIAWLRTRRRA